MRVVRSFAALITAVGVAFVGGCGSGGEPAARATTAETHQVSVGPKEQLEAGVRALNTTTFRVVETVDVAGVSGSTQGMADPARRALRLTQSASANGRTTSTEVVALGTDIYLRYEVPVVPGVPTGKWSHVDGRRLRSLAALGFGDGDDLSGKSGLVGALTRVERTGPLELAGTFDLSRAVSVLPGAAGVLGDGSKDAPWKGRFDQEGRLVWLSVTIPEGGGLPGAVSDTTYSGFGEPVTVERPPAGDTVEAPEGLYKLFDR